MCNAADRQRYRKRFAIRLLDTQFQVRIKVPLSSMKNWNIELKLELTLNFYLRFRWIIVLVFFILGTKVNARTARARDVTETAKPIRVIKVRTKTWRALSCWLTAFTSIKIAKWVRWLQRHTVWVRLDSTLKKGFIIFRAWNQIMRLWDPILFL